MRNYFKLFSILVTVALLSAATLAQLAGANRNKAAPKPVNGESNKQGQGSVGLPRCSAELSVEKLPTEVRL